MTTRKSTVLASVFVAFLLLQSVAGSAGTLEAGFESPPVSAKPQIWWHWMNGNVTREGITADLESMRRVGIGEANIITVASGIPHGPVPVMSARFFDMVQFAAQEADRLGMTLCMDNCPGWSSSGGPWVAPEHAMQFVTTSETTVSGPALFSGKLMQPPTKKDFYRDIAVLAFKTPASEDELSMPDNPPKIATSVLKIDPSSLLVHGSDKSVKFPAPTADKPYFIQIEYPRRVTARTLIIVGEGSIGRGYASGKILTSYDGTSFDVLRPFSIPHGASVPTTISLGKQPVSARIFRLQFDHAPPGLTGIALKEINLRGELMIQNIAARAAFEPDEVDSCEVAKDEEVTSAPHLVLHRDAIVDLTSALKPDGSLIWNVPEGHWTILRIGYTPTGKTNHPAPPEATGLECNKLSPDGLDASWNGMMQPILDRLGPLAGKILDDCLIDSYEVGDQNWTPRMIDEFKRLRGYDPTPLLPVMTGRVVDSPEVSERFLWDVRRTVADLLAKNYYAHFTELCHEHGLKSLVEPYTGPFESLQCGAANDIPMGEFWTNPQIDASVKMASSVGHVYGQTVIGAESYTSFPQHAKWMDDPYSLKAVGDLAFCQGINRFIFHRFAHQPWLDRFPGVTMGKWGMNLDRTNTWFEMSKAWMQYITRSQFMLQQGRSVADVAYFCGQSAPVLVREGNPPLPKGYDYDDINADVLLTRTRVVNHRLVLADGASYAVLVLPAADPEMTPQLLGKIREFVNEGAIVVGPRPDHSPSLQDYPNCDLDVRKSAAELWGDCDGKTVTDHALGSGKVVWGQSLDQVLSGINLAPDFQSGVATVDSEINYIHRTLDNTDLYFLANHSADGNALHGGEAVHQDCTFRISGKVPELWHPDTGVMEPAPAYQVKGGRTTIAIDFDPSGSVFVVFREADPIAGDHVVAASRQLRSDPVIPVKGPWELHFPPHWGAPPSITLDRLISWPHDTDQGVKYFSGTATYVKDLEIPADLLAKGNLLFLDLGEVKNLAQVKLNATDLGILWKPPFRVDIASAAKPGINHLEISVVNLWPNRLIGDEQLPEDVEWRADGGLAKWPLWLLNGKPSPTGRLTFTTWHHITKDMPLLPSGLLGPVILQPAKWVPAK